jgi:hypothetical protein
MRPWIRAAQEHRGEPSGEIRDYRWLTCSILLLPNAFGSHCRRNAASTTSIGRAFRRFIAAQSSSCPPAPGLSKRKPLHGRAVHSTFGIFQSQWPRRSHGCCTARSNWAATYTRTCSTLRYGFCGSPPSTAPSVGVALLIDGTDLYELIQLDKRADRVLPNGWCTPAETAVRQGERLPHMPQVGHRRLPRVRTAPPTRRHRAPGRNPPGGIHRQVRSPDGRRQHLAPRPPRRN